MHMLSAPCKINMFGKTNDGIHESFHFWESIDIVFGCINNYLPTDIYVSVKKIIHSFMIIKVPTRKTKNLATKMKGYTWNFK